MESIIIHPSLFLTEYVLSSYPGTTPSWCWPGRWPPASLQETQWSSSRPRSHPSQPSSLLNWSSRLDSLLVSSTSYQAQVRKNLYFIYYQVIEMHPWFGFITKFTRKYKRMTLTAKRLRSHHYYYYYWNTMQKHYINGRIWNLENSNKLTWFLISFLNTYCKTRNFCDMKLSCFVSENDFYSKKLLLIVKTLVLFQV